MTLRLASSAFSLVIVFATAHAEAQVTEYTDFAQWQVSAGPHATIDFTGYPAFTIITTQYSSLGVTFTDGNDAILTDDPFTFPIDGAGLYGNLDDAIRLSFSTPQTSIGVHSPSLMAILLYDQRELVYASSILFDPATSFAGLTSIMPFDSATLVNPLTGFAFIDNLYFAPGIPAPGALLLLAVAGSWPGVRRRRTVS